MLLAEIAHYVFFQCKLNMNVSTEKPSVGKVKASPAKLFDMLLDMFQKTLI